MKLYNSLYEFSSTQKTIVTIGTFDGVHVGHKHILKKIVLDAKKNNCESLVLTFFPHPRMILQVNSDVKLLNTIKEKSNLLEKIGIDNLIIHPFDKEFSKLTAEEFVKTILVEKFNIQKIIIGYDHQFGRNRTATIDDLIIFGKQFEFDVEQISAQQINEISVSSTKIRNSLLVGNIALANSYLGYSFMLTGIVVKGNQLGRTIGFPTANIQISENYKLIPKNGVYIVTAIVNNKTIFGMMNIGVKPTLGENVLSIEVHLLQFSEDIYGQKIQVNVIERLRDEQKFNSLTELKHQIELDKQKTTRFFEILNS